MVNKSTLLAPITSNDMYQQKQEQDGYLIKLYFYTKLEDLVFTNFLLPTTVYARFIDGELQPHKKRFSDLEWLDTNLI